MENLNNTNPSDPIIQDSPDDEHLMMGHVIQDEHDLYYLHVCLSEILCKKNED